MTSFKDWIVEVSSTTGTGAYSLGGAPAGSSYFRFRQRYADGDTEVCYWVRNNDRTKWEKNRFTTLTYGSPDTLTRDVIESTNGDAAVSWVSGDLPLRIFCAPDSEVSEFAINMGFGTTRPDVLRYGVWGKEDGLAADFDQLRLFGGGSIEDVLGVFNKINGLATLYGLPPRYLSGLELSRSSTTVVGVAAGVAMDSDNEVGIILASAFTKSTGGAWAQGSGQNGMGNGLTIANSTWYHVHAIINDGEADCYIDTSVSAANAPTGTTHFRRLGSFKTNGSAQIIDFLQHDDHFFVATTSDFSFAATSGPTLRTLTVPTGLIVLPLLTIAAIGAAGNATQVTLAPGGNSALSDIWQFMQDNNAAGNQSKVALIGPPTNTSAQINVTIGGAAPSGSISSHGWIDRRGKR